MERSCLYMCTCVIRWVAAGRDAQISFGSCVRARACHSHQCAASYPAARGAHMHACVLPALRWLHRHMRHDDRSARHMGSTVVGFQPRAREDAPGPTSAASASAGAGDATAIIASPSPCARASPRRAYARMELAYAALMPLTERAGSSTRRGTARAPVSGHAAETEARSTTRARRRARGDAAHSATPAPSASSYRAARSGTRARRRRRCCSLRTQPAR